MKYLLLIVLILCGCSNNIEPKATYDIYTVIDSSGKTYTNLHKPITSDGNKFVDIDGKRYIFHGNYTVISSTISGYNLLKLRREKE